MRSKEEIEKKIDELYDELINTPETDLFKPFVINLKLRVLEWVLGEVDEI